MFLEKSEDKNNNATYNSRTEKEDFVNNLNVKKDEDKDDEQKEDNSESPKRDESAI